MKCSVPHHSDVFRNAWSHHLHKIAKSWNINLHIISIIWFTDPSLLQEIIITVLMSLLVSTTPSSICLFFSAAGYCNSD